MPDISSTVQGLWTNRQTADFLGISVSQLYVLLGRNNGLKSFKVGGQRRYDPADVREWLNTRCTKEAAA